MRDWQELEPAWLMAFYGVGKIRSSSRQAVAPPYRFYLHRDAMLVA